jgi:hypothetical protein
VKLENKSPANVVEQFHVIEQLGAHTADFVTGIEKQQLTEELASGIKTLILAQQYCLASADHALSASAAVDDVVKDLHPNPLSDLQKFIRTSRRILSAVSSSDDEAHDEAYFENKLAESKQAYEEMKTMVLRYAMSSMLTIQASMALMDLIKIVQQMCEQFIKARAQLHSMNVYLGA